MARLSKIVVFLVLAHGMLFFAQGAGFLPQQSANPNQQFVQNVTGEDVQSSVSGINGSRTVDQNYDISFESRGFISTVTGILFAPYSVVDGLSLPAMLEFLFKNIMGILEIVAFAGFIRGVVV